MKADIWFDGSFVGWDAAGVHPFCFSMQRGATLFESIDCRETADGRPAIFRLRDHMLRFENSARIIGMPLPCSLNELLTAAKDTVARSGMKSCTIRPLGFYTDPVMQVYPGQDNPVSVAIGLGDTPPPKKSYTLHITATRKIDSRSMPVKAKVSANYIGPMLAKTEAVELGFDDACILNYDGMVAEGSTSNIFIIEDGVLYTPPEDAILPGITRDTIAIMAGRIGREVVMEPISPGRLKNADEVIMCSSGTHVAPVVRVDDAVIGSGEPGPVTGELADMYRQVITGAVPKLTHWLTIIDP